MPGATTRLAIPTMLDTDPLADVAEAIRDVANWLDAKLPYYTTGNMVVTAAVSGDLVVTWPVGMFAAAPVVSATPQASGSNPGNYFLTIVSVSNVNCTIRARQYEAVVGTAAFAIHVSARAAG